ncbi:hypothetical protein LJC71_02575 [Desulfosarcina sp. OttesenSCG-928-A07]|nr:hypothetical protein [Desulfosarcina sp. OttesenSCG-928-G17]MDL2328622.1 hypothetical protein [Desulfosarcina sp. OttesenSCG-928-A07]
MAPLISGHISGWIKALYSRCGPVICAVAGVFFLSASPVLATQGHSGIEGVWVHQFAHLFFLFSMGLLIFWLRRAGLVKKTAWRYIQNAAFFFIIWNADAALVHFLEEQLIAVEMTMVGGGQVRIDLLRGSDWISVIYYLGKLDHIFCVPAMICLMLGVRRMLADHRHETAARGEIP